MLHALAAMSVVPPAPGTTATTDSIVASPCAIRSLSTWLTIFNPAVTPTMKASGHAPIHPPRGASRHSIMMPSTSASAMLHHCTSSTGFSEGCTCACTIAGTSAPNSLGTSVSQKPITIQYAALTPTTVASASL